jgi:hypothetical protein
MSSVTMTKAKAEAVAVEILKAAEAFGGANEANYIAVMRAIVAEAEKRAAHAEHFHPYGVRLAAAAG